MMKGGFMNKKTIRQLPEASRPYEKCKLYGAQVLSDSELLACFIRTGTSKKNCTDVAYELLKSLPGSNLAGILHCDPHELTQIDGIGEVKALQFECMGELCKRIIKTDISSNNKVFTTPDSIAHYYMNELRQKNTEYVMIMLLDNKNAIIRDIELSHGTFNASILSPADVFHHAIRYRASSVVVVHNHPSGNPTPSTEDLDITTKLIETSKLVGISFLDHIIIGDNKYCSIKQLGYIF
jgi:DNA repair protein RadC